MKKKQLVILVLDAFRWDYVNSEDAPFLNEMAQKHTWGKKVKSASGFTQPAAMFTGAQPENSDIFTLFDYNENKSAFMRVKKRKMLGLLFKSYAQLMKIPSFKVQKFVDNTLMANILLPNANLFSPRIYKPFGTPAEFLPYIYAEEENDSKLISEISSYMSRNIETLQDMMFKNDIRFKFLMSPVADGYATNVIDDTVKKLKEDNQMDFDAYFFQFNDTDSLIHKCGPDTKEAKRIIKHTDSEVKRLYKEFAKNNEDVSFLVVGDHGMSTVTDNVDILDEIDYMLKINNLNAPTDLVYWVDSTMARFWFHNENARQKVEKHIKNNQTFQKYGVIVDDKISQEEKIPKMGRQHAHLAWWANEGILIEPCFFRDSEDFVTNGMHGYRSIGSTEQTKGSMVFFGKNIENKNIENVDLIDVCATTCDFFEIPYPNINESISLQKR